MIIKQRSAWRRELQVVRDWKRSAAFAEAIFVALQSAMGSNLGEQRDENTPYTIKTRDLI